MSANILSEIPICLNLKTILLAQKVLSELIKREPEIKILDQTSDKSKAINEKIQEISAKILKEYREDAERIYIPDIIGFFNCCKEHEDKRLPTGVYILMDRLKQYSSIRNVDTNLLFLQVFFHEYGHLFIHSHGIKNTLSSLDKFNFEEPFCELVSFLMTFEEILYPGFLFMIFLKSDRGELDKIMTPISLRIRDSLVMNKLRNRKKLQNNTVYPYILIGIEGDESIKRCHKEEFICRPRIYPYKFFTDFATYYGTRAIDFFELSRIFLNGIIKLYCINSPCAVSYTHLTLPTN